MGMKASRAPRRHNYRATPKPATLCRQAEILEWLQLFGEGFSMRDLAAALGCSRQLALYHCKKMAAAGKVVLILGACEQNAGVQFRVWDEASLAAHYARRAQPSLQVVRNAA